MADRNDYSFEVDGLDEGTLRVLRFEGREGISETFEFDLELTSPDPDIELESVVGKPAVLTIHTDDEPRLVQGLVSRFELTRNGRKLAFYRAQLVPRAWVTTLSKRCRIFQEKTTPQILEAVLDQVGVTPRLELNRKFKPRLYCVQYRESDFQFLSRLMEEEGLFYFFASTEDSEEMVISDNPSVHKPLPWGADPVVPFRQEETGLQGTISVSSFKVRRSMRTGVVTLREFDFKKPTLDLTVKKEGDAETAYEYYDYPGEYPDPALGKTYAEIRLQQLRTGREIAEGQSDCRTFTSGFKFELSGHTRDGFNGEYLLIGVRHTGNQPSAAEEEGGDSGGANAYSNSFFAIPVAIPFRPRRRTPRPTIDGVQTAIVTGPSGEEIHTDEHGRVKVQFHWDRDGQMDDKSSCWVRVAQLQTSGSMLLPRIGWEVIVDFHEGDPDRPIIVGRLHNGGEPGPYGLPGSKTMMSFKSGTSPGGGNSNEIRFEDSGDHEEFFVHASKDWNIVVDNDKALDVVQDEKIAIGRHRTKTVGENQSEEVGGNKNIEVKKDHSETIHGGMTLKVDGGLTETIGKNHGSTVSGDRSETIKGAYKQAISKSAKQTVSRNLKVGVTGQYALSVGVNHKVTVKGKSNTQVKGDTSVSTDGKLNLTTEKEAVLTAKGKITIEGKDGITLKAGSAKIVLDKSGKITIEGSDIKVKGSGDVILKGSKVAAN